MTTINFIQKPRSTAPAKRFEDNIKPADFSFVVVRRNGKPPLRFGGTLLHSETSYRSGTHLWYEVNVYRRTKGGYVLETKCFKKNPDIKDTFSAAQCTTLGEMMVCLEQYDTRFDIEADVQLGKNIPTAELVLQAVILRQKLDEAQREYDSVSTAMIDEFIQYDQTS